jgi:hypothetical protein
MSYDILSSVSQNVLKFYQQLTGEERRKLTNQKQELPVAAMFVNGSKRNEQSL